MTASMPSSGSVASRAASPMMMNGGNVSSQKAARVAAISGGITGSLNSSVNSRMVKSQVMILIRPEVKNTSATPIRMASRKTENGIASSQLRTATYQARNRRRRSEERRVGKG